MYCNMVFGPRCVLDYHFFQFELNAKISSVNSFGFMQVPNWFSSTVFLKFLRSLSNPFLLRHGLTPSLYK
jgi:hypothetical protein